MAKSGVQSAAVNLLTECAVIQYQGDRDSITQDLADTLTSKVQFSHGLSSLQSLSKQRTLCRT